jgi:hypothetical protein
MIFWTSGGDSKIVAQKENPGMDNNLKAEAQSCSGTYFSGILAVRGRAA